MQTELMDKCVVGVPWLERYMGHGEAVQQSPLHSFPFSIGRVASADLQIDDPRVSREHAVILREGKAYRVRDLGSTNGTVLNGQRIQESALNDGDILVIADAEFTFYSGHTNDSYATVTQVMGGTGRDTAPDTPRDVVRALRRDHEALAQRGIEIRYRPIVDLTSDTAWGYEAIDDRSSRSWPGERLVASGAARIVNRQAQLSRMIAAEEAAQASGRLFLKIDPAELGTEALIDSLERLRDTALDPNRLVAQISESIATDTPQFRELHARLQALGLGLAYEGFAAGKAQILERQELPPNYLKLAPAVMQGLARNSDRLRQVQLIVRACHDIGCQAIATGIRTNDEAKICHEIGCHFAEGELFGEPLPGEAAFAKPAEQNVRKSGPASTSKE